MGSTTCFQQLDRTRFQHIALFFLSIMLLEPTPCVVAQSGFEFTGANCIAAYNLGEPEVATISMWLRLKVRPEGEISILSTDNWDVSGLHLLLTEERRILLTVNGSEPEETVSRGPVGKRIGDWVHLAVVLDHENRLWKIYLDGKLDNSTQLEETVPINLNDFRLGAWNQVPRAFIGWMDDIRIYDRALTADEVAALARRMGTKRGLLAWWPLGDSDDDQVEDRSGHEHHGEVCEAGDIDFEDKWSEDEGDEDEGNDGEPGPPDPPEVKPINQVSALHDAINCLAERFPDYQRDANRFHARVDALSPQNITEQQLDPVRYDALVRNNPLFDFSRLLFIKRYTFQSSHFYTDFIDGCSQFGGNLSILDLKTGEVTDLIPEMSDGIFGRFDLHFSAERVVFDWKASPRQGFRIYEIDIDPKTGMRTGGPRQLTHPPDDEAARIAKYSRQGHAPEPGAYFHQTDDMHPCYLPDGGIIFTSTRCEYGILCDADDAYSTAVLYRMDADGSHFEKLTNSAVSEFCPTMMADGRVLYTRWEYVDKGQLGVKCLWAMRPDGTGSTEVYGNNIPFPPTFMYGRQIPGDRHGFVFVGAPHFPQGGSFGTIIRIDTREDIRTRLPMTYLTPNVDIRQEGGWNQLRGSKWQRDARGPLYTDPYPLNTDFYLVSHNPDQPWSDEGAYGLYLLDSFGNHQLLYRDEEFTCREPFPLRPKETPPVLTSSRDSGLALQKLATCVVADVHRGMEGIKPGEVKYLRIMEQVPRPWDARRFWDQDSEYDSHTHLISEGTALAAKVMWGVVPVEEDGSAYFHVPADRNIYLQALDENYMELQRERTYVNYRPGEMRSCIGCHERPNEVTTAGGTTAASPMAMQRPPRALQAQPGDDKPEQVIHYPTYVQPVLDKFCVRCHSDRNSQTDLDLTGKLTTHFSRSYSQILERGLVKTYRESSDFGGTHYAPPKTIGSHASRLMSQIQEGCPGMEPLPKWAFIRLATWVDASGVYYGSYWGRRHVRFQDHAWFRPVPTFNEAISTRGRVPVEAR